MDAIRKVKSHWFFLCCGALVNVPSSFERVESFAHEYVLCTLQSALTDISRLKPANLVAFDAPAFHPIFATTFIQNFFFYIIIEGRRFNDTIGLLLSGLPLSRHTGIVRFWTHSSAVKKCTLKWAHRRTQPWGEQVPYQCSNCGRIQAWDQKSKAPATELHGGVTMRCSHGQCTQSLTFDPPSPDDLFKALKQPEGVWVAFGVGKSDFL
jgi:hypothetical protein